MRNHYVLALVALMSLGACRDEPQKIADMPTVPSAFPELLFPPGGTLMARAGSEDALQLIFHAPGSPADVAAAYRIRLTVPPWAIVSDKQEGDVSTIYAESQGRPIWVRVMPEPGVGSRIELNGAVLQDRPAAPEVHADSSVAR